MIRNTETDLHALLDDLTDGEHTKTTWVRDKHTTTVEGPVSVDGREVFCQGFIRWNNGDIDPALASVEVTRDEEVTVTRDDEEALHALIDSLEDGQGVAAEWRDAQGSMTLTGSAMSNGGFTGVRGFITFPLLWGDSTLHSVTARRPVVQRWERGGNE